MGWFLGFGDVEKMRKFIGLISVGFLVCLVFLPLVSASVIESNSGTFTTHGLIQAEHPTTNPAVSSAFGQVFNASVAEYVYNVTVRMEKSSGSVDANFTVALCSVQGISGSRYPNAVLETSDVLDSSNLALTYNDFTFNFSGTTLLAQYSMYGFYVYSDDAVTLSAANYVMCGQSGLTNAGSNVFYYHNGWEVVGALEMIFTINGEVGAGSPTPTPTPAPSSSAGDGDATLEYWSGKLMPWLAYAVILLIPAFLGLKFLGQMGFIVGLNIGAFLIYLVFPEMLWIMLVFGILDLMVVFYLRG